MHTPDELTAMLEDCLKNPVPSRHHEWFGSEQSQYSSLHWRGRSLYDSLRTKYDLDHYTAYDMAHMMYGGNPPLPWNT